MNLQRITNDAWSLYMLKYSMKCEPAGSLHLNRATATQLGLGHLSDLQLKIVGALHLHRSISVAEAALTCSQFPIVSSSRAVDVVAFHYCASKSFYKSRFPLALAYALTAHKAQGATISGSTVINARSCFTPGLLYVMLSRVTRRSHVKVMNARLTPDLFAPVPFFANTVDANAIPPAFAQLLQHAT